MIWFLATLVTVSGTVCVALCGEGWFRITSAMIAWGISVGAAMLLALEIWSRQL